MILERIFNFPSIILGEFIEKPPIKRLIFALSLYLIIALLFPYLTSSHINCTDSKNTSINKISDIKNYKITPFNLFTFNLSSKNHSEKILLSFVISIIFFIVFFTSLHWLQRGRIIKKEIKGLIVSSLLIISIAEILSELWLFGVLFTTNKIACSNSISSLVSGSMLIIIVDIIIYLWTFNLLMILLGKVLRYHGEVILFHYAFWTFLSFGLITINENAVIIPVFLGLSFSIFCILSVLLYGIEWVILGIFLSFGLRYYYDEKHQKSALILKAIIALHDLSFWLPMPMLDKYLYHIFFMDWKWVLEYIIVFNYPIFDSMKYKGRQSALQKILKEDKYLELIVFDYFLKKKYSTKVLSEFLIYDRSELYFVYFILYYSIYTTISEEKIEEALQDSVVYVRDVLNSDFAFQIPLLFDIFRQIIQVETVQEIADSKDSIKKLYYFRKTLSNEAINIIKNIEDFSIAISNYINILDEDRERSFIKGAKGMIDSIEENINKIKIPSERAILFMIVERWKNVLLIKLESMGMNFVILVKNIKQETEYVNSLSCFCGGKYKIDNKKSEKYENKTMDTFYLSCTNCRKKRDITFEISNVSINWLEKLWNKWIAKGNK